MCRSERFQVSGISGRGYGFARWGWLAIVLLVWMAVSSACGDAKGGDEEAVVTVNPVPAATMPVTVSAPPESAKPVFAAAAANILVRELQAATATPQVVNAVGTQISVRTALEAAGSAKTGNISADSENELPTPAVAAPAIPFGPTALPVFTSTPEATATSSTNAVDSLQLTPSEIAVRVEAHAVDFTPTATPVRMPTGVVVPALPVTPTSTTVPAATPTTSQTPTATETPSQTATSTATVLPLPTYTATATVMPTFTATATSTSTPFATVTPTQPPTYAPTHTAVPEHCRIKGNINSSGEKIYHTTASTFYSRTEIDTEAGERWFCTEQEAQAAGWRAPRQRQAMPTTTAVKSNASAGCGAVVNVNRAGVEELEDLPGIGPVKAQAIVDYRKAHGEFANVEELDEVDGIGEKTLEKIAPCVIFD